ncbi:hypothetical protein, partial [Clostridium sp. ZBS17]|uniref:hypothetical protein n=1 Tax=Clostridium sp. ZBS17 TaxID=2949968 RepID=UPI00207A2520
QAVNVTILIEYSQSPITMPLCLLQISQYILNIKINLINCMFKMTLYYVKVYIDYYIRLENVHT